MTDQQSGSDAEKAILGYLKEKVVQRGPGCQCPTEVIETAQRMLGDGSLNDYAAGVQSLEDAAVAVVVEMYRGRCKAHPQLSPLMEFPGFEDRLRGAACRRLGMQSEAVFGGFGSVTGGSDEVIVDIIPLFDPDQSPIRAADGGLNMSLVLALSVVRRF